MRRESEQDDDEPHGQVIHVTTPPPADRSGRVWIAAGAVGAAAFGTLCWQVGSRLPIWPFVLFTVALSVCMVLATAGFVYPKVAAARPHPTAHVTWEPAGFDAATGEMTYRRAELGRPAAHELPASHRGPQARPADRQVRPD